MAFTQQFIPSPKRADAAGFQLRPTNASFGGTEVEGSTTGYGIPQHSWQNSGTTMVSDGVELLIPDHTTDGRWLAVHQGSMTGSGFSYPRELAGMMTTNGGDNWSSGALTFPTYNSGAFTKMYDWDTNGSTSSPKWMITGGAYPNYDTTNSGGSNIACYFSTNFTTWSRISVDRDNTFGGNTINQYISAVCYSNGYWVVGNGRTGKVNRSNNDGSSWGSWVSGANSFRPVYALTSNDGGSQVVCAGQGYMAYSSNSGQSFTTSSLSNGSDRIHNLIYIPGYVSVGNTQKGPGVWVGGGGRYNTGYQNMFSSVEVYYYSTDGQNWTFIDTANDTNLATRTPTFGNKWRIVDSRDGKLFTWGDDGSGGNGYKFYMSDMSLTNWTEITSQNPFTGTTGNSYPQTYAEKGDNYRNGRYMVGSGMGSAYRNAAGRIAYLDIL
tara:strand:- start:192 stop:1502 length:1311 start_codon:yes stop_codon:yes gene_type:complete